MALKQQYLNTILMLVFAMKFCSGFVIMKNPEPRLDLSTLLTRDESKDKCVPVTIGACKKLGYNETRLSTFSNTRLLEDVSNHLEMMERKTCSADLLFFTCMVYNPICFNNHIERVLPCRSVCENVKKDCSGSMAKLGIAWPTELNCENFPNYETDVCIRRQSIITKDQLSKAPPVENTDQEPCGKKCQKRRPHIQKFGQYRRSDYVVEAQFKSKTRTSDGNYKLQFKVIRVFKPGKVIVQKYGVLNLWTDSPCMCAKIAFDQSYFILGKESMNKETQSYRMILTDDTIIDDSSYHFKRTLKKWKRRYRALLEREVEELERIKNYNQALGVPL